jgi:uncharacterized protein YbaR (Trm112 family)
MESSGQLEKALSELARVGRRGYIETPSAAFEKLLGAPYHHWYVTNQNGVIAFRRKTDYAEFAELMRIFLPLQRDSRTFFRLLFENFDRFFVGIEWEGRIDYLIEGIPTEGEATVVNDYPGDLRSGYHNLGGTLQREHQMRMRMKQIMHKLLGGQAVADIFQILACPVCKTRVAVSSSHDAVVCCLCNRSYPVRNGVPVMLLEESSLIGPAA